MCIKTLLDGNTSTDSLVNLTPSLTHSLSPSLTHSLASLSQSNLLDCYLNHSPSAHTLSIAYSSLTQSLTHSVLSITRPFPRRTSKKDYTSPRSERSELLLVVVFILFLATFICKVDPGCSFVVSTEPFCIWQRCHGGVNTGVPSDSLHQMCLIDVCQSAGTPVAALSSPGSSRPVRCRRINGANPNPSISCMCCSCPQSSGSRQNTRHFPTFQSHLRWFT